MASIAIEASEFPIVRLVFPSRISIEDVDQLGEALKELHRARGPFVSIADLGRLETEAVTALHRKRIAEHADELARRGAFRAEFVVVPSLLLRAMFTGYTWLRVRKSHPQSAHATFEEALGEARSLLRDSNSSGAATGMR